jgi:hypothetical protein
LIVVQTGTKQSLYRKKQQDALIEDNKSLTQTNRNSEQENLPFHKSTIVIKGKQKCRTLTTEDLEEHEKKAS